jgi:hypothetical protein
MSDRSFSCIYRADGDWDIVVDGSRLFAIRKGDGDFQIRDDRPRADCGTYRHTFPTLDSAMAWVAGMLMRDTPQPTGPSA